MTINKHYKFLVVLIFFISAFIFGGCIGGNDECEHSYVDGECIKCGDIDPNYKPDPENPEDLNKDNSKIIEKVQGQIYYVSPNGTRDASCTREDPGDFYVMAQRIKCGDTLILLDGTYNLSSRITFPKERSGNFASHITIKAENCNKAIIDFSKMKFNSSNRGIQVDGDYYYLYGLNVTGAGDNGVYIGGNYNIVEMCMFYRNRDTGLQIGRSEGSFTTIDKWPHNNLIKNCTSFDNYDDETYGENADGFAAKLTVGEGNVFDGCIAYRNCDDGWDLYAKSDSGNVGKTIIKNCISFENGWTLSKHLEDYKNENSPMTTLTRDGDGIGFKLGGEKMEGSVVVENCISFNNRLHGFSDNSNPGVITIKNCTSYNNSVNVNANGDITGLLFESNNFDLARANTIGDDSNSYNNYYGLLSVIDYENELSGAEVYGDRYRGSCAYSIFVDKASTDSKIKQYTIKNYIDANSYQNSEYIEEIDRLNKSIFTEVALNREDYYNFHYTMRNADGSLNVNNLFNINSQELLTYCDGQSIGANLSQPSWDNYTHEKWEVPTLGTATEDYVQVLGAYNVLDIMCDKSAVYQNIKLLTTCNNCNVTWKADNSEILAFSEEPVISFSKLSYLIGNVNKDRLSAHEIKLTATISYNKVSMDKEFTLMIMKDSAKIGDISGLDKKYIVEQNEDWDEPEIVVLNKTSYSGAVLVENEDYLITKTFEFTNSINEEFKACEQFDTSKAGVYRVNYLIKSLVDEKDFSTQSCLVYISSPDAIIDVDKTSGGINFFVSNNGVKIIANLSSPSGYMYVFKTSSSYTTANKIKSSGERIEIKNHEIEEEVMLDNSQGYNLFVVLVNKAGTYTSDIYGCKIELKSISTCQEFYKMVNSSSSSTTIYSIQNDLDFENFTWQESKNTSAFKGLLNGNNHTISNIKITGKSEKNVNIFYKIDGATIYNLNFSNITFEGDTSKTVKVGIIGEMRSSYIDNVRLTNISCSAYQSAGGLVGSIIGGKNYLNRISLTNDENSRITVTGKYCGGIVGNVQKGTSEEIVEAYIDNCTVNAIIGSEIDTGGYSGGIVGRYKNDYDTCLLSIQHCVVYGKVMTGKNYAAGITGGCDNGFGKTIIKYCVSDIILYYVGTIIDGYKATSIKNGSPIMGRQTLGTGSFTYLNNYGAFPDYNPGVSDGEGLEFSVRNEYFWKTTLKYDMENIWNIDLENGIATLKH